MKFFLRIIALLLAFTLPVYGLASVSKDCDHHAMEQAGSSLSAMMVTESGVEAALAAPAEKMQSDKFEISFSCSATDNGQQCQLGILPSPLVLAGPLSPVYPPGYNSSFNQVFLELPQRPPLAV